MVGAIGGALRGGTRPRRGVVKFVLARSDFGNRAVERTRAEWRRWTIDLRRRRARPRRPGAAGPGAGPALPERDSRSATAVRRAAKWRRSTAGRRRARRCGLAARRSWRGVGREICSIWRVMEFEPLVNVGDVAASPGRGIGRWSEARPKSGGADSPMVELSQSLSDMPARRAAASARSRTDGSMPSTLHDTREFMLSSGSDSGAATCAFSLPARPLEETIEFRAGRLPLGSTFSCYGKQRVKEFGRPAQSCRHLRNSTCLAARSAAVCRGEPPVRGAGSAGCRFWNEPIAALQNLP